MRKKLWLGLLLLGMTACQPSAEKEVAVPLKEVDMYADYPMRQLDIGELAEVTYLPLDRKLNSKDQALVARGQSVLLSIPSYLLSIREW